MAEVSGSQFGKVLKNTMAGGDSVNIVTGQRPDRGYMVSDEGSETVVKAANMSGDKIARHVHKHEEVLTTDPTAHLGTWRDQRYGAHGTPVPSPNDKVYMDVSRKHSSPFMAYQAGIREHQLAVYDVHSKDVIPVTPVPNTHRAKRRLAPHVERGM
jgi:hypothetical protein